MKNLFPLFFLFYISTAINAQCPLIGITTNPAAPVNNQLPSNKNLYFDWTQPTWQNNSTCQLSTQIESPFYKVDNLEALRTSKDMKPEDGWELIRRDFGYTDQNVLKTEVPDHSYFILYNKFTGILRVLLKTCRGVDYNGAKITIKFDATTSFQSGLLDYSATARALDETHLVNPAIQSASVFVNDKTKWFYADFPITYDPCTCKYKSKINIISHLIQNSQIQLQGSITGTITTITNGQGSVAADGSYSFKDFANDADKLKKGFISVDNFITQTKNVAQTLPNSAGTVAAIDNLQAGLKSLNFLKTGSAAVPWLKAAVGVLDFFTGGGKTSPQTVQLMPMAVNLSLKVNGTMTTANQYHDIKFSNPGTLDAQNDPAIYPFYNEILGVFNIMNGPVFSSKISASPIPNQPGFWTQNWSFKLKQPIKWVLNPASKLQVQDAQIAFVAQKLATTGTPPPTPPVTLEAGEGSTLDAKSQGFNFLEGKDATTGLYEYRTEYKDFNCLGNEFKFSFNRAKVPLPNYPVLGQVFIKMIINLKRIDNPSAQNILLVLKYPVKIENITTALNGSLFNPGLCNGGMMLQATGTEINTFCASTQYKTNRQMRPVQNNESPETKEDILVNIAPNPASHTLNLSGNLNNEKVTQIQITDMLGKLHFNNKENLFNEFSKSYTIHNMPNGVYVMKLICLSGKIRAIKFIVNK